MLIPILRLLSNSRSCTFTHASKHTFVPVQLEMEKAFSQ